MNLLEFENQQFGDLWNEQTIKELKEYQPPKKENDVMFPDVDRSDERFEMHQDEFHCMRGWKFPQWFE